MSEDEPLVVTIPTELGRPDTFLVLGIGGGGVALFYGLSAFYGMPSVIGWAGALLSILWVVTSRAATDVPVIGAIAVVLRNRLGERDVHHWLMAWAHYIHLTQWPTWRVRLHWFGLFLLSKHRMCDVCGKSLI